MLYSRYYKKDKKDEKGKPLPRELNSNPEEKKEPAPSAPKESKKKKKGKK